MFAKLYGALRRLFHPSTSVQLILPHLDSVKFHYVSRSTLPDMVEVWMGDDMLYHYAWIEGEMAYPLSDLGRLHAEFERRQSQERAKQTYNLQD